MKTRGFTLIELLVVIAIIGVLSSVVLASLNTARLRGKDAAVRSGLQQMRTAYELEFSSSGTYDPLKASHAPNGWFSTSAQCQAGNFTGTNAASARSICASIVSAAGPCTSDACLLTGHTSTYAPGVYSIMAYLPGESQRAGAARWLCVGSGGATSVTGGDPWSEPGCWGNP